MSLYTTIHLHNVPVGREAAYADWFAGDHRTGLEQLAGFVAADRYTVARAQVMPDIPQPWRFMTVYEFDCANPEMDLPPLARLIAQARSAGLIDDATETERLYTYAMYSDWVASANYQPDQPLSGVSIILANFVAGREAEYHRWYNEVHGPEVTAVPGHVAMKRGRLSALQLEPRRYCPGSDLVLCAQQTSDLLFTIRDFSARARGASPSGVAMEPRSSAGSFARTVHYFDRISGDRQWAGGIAYAGDLDAYPAELFAAP